ncbi:dihydrodipicolinate reductase [Sulfitobacter sp. SK012]|uniref:dihydrodipicolinate reductase n=1 Tax=Sulfitobacter sp. SK012 TaxID=1389005 RepID=UPI000E0BDDE1|nr:dihydrodipicolinate reductase [Sulfitobacter sp. SK012]AXI48262.1 dihydrodipicolinate reductase [Sulfitobacter sp. SK012]
MKFIFALITAIVVSAAPALADFATVKSEAAFVQLVRDKTLTRPLVKINLSPSGKISGKGAIWDVAGKWTWEDGFFCRSLEWGGDDLGYNCQEVAASGTSIRFTSDQGTGDSADFRLR